MLRASQNSIRGFREFEAWPDDHPQAVRSYRLTQACWPNGASATLDGRGLLHLRAADKSLPECTLVLCERELAAWTSDGEMYGRRALHRTPDRPDLEREIHDANLTTVMAPAQLPLPSSRRGSTENARAALVNAIRKEHCGTSRGRLPDRPRRRTMTEPSTISRPTFADNPGIVSGSADDGMVYPGDDPLRWFHELAAWGDDLLDVECLVIGRAADETIHGLLAIPPHHRKCPPLGHAAPVLCRRFRGCFCQPTPSSIRR